MKQQYCPKCSGPVRGILPTVVMERIAVCVFCLLALLWMIPAEAEVSVNLHKRETVGKKSHRVEEAWWEDEAGNRAFAEDLGWASATYKYNKKPRCTEERYYDLEGELCMTRDGYAIVRQKWDGNGRLVQRAYFDTQENPVIGPEGYHREQRVYDHLKLDHVSRYDTQDELIRSDTQWARLQYTYNNMRQCTRIEYLNGDLEPIEGPGKYARLERTWKKSEMTSEYFYDAAGSMTVNGSRGYAGYLQVYDDDGVLIREEYYGDHGSLMMYKEEYAVIVREYGKSKKLPERIYYYDTEGNPAIQKGGWASVAYTYDFKGRIETTAYFNEHGERMTIGEGYSKIEQIWAVTGDIRVEAYYGINDEPVIHPEKGYARVERRFYNAGQIRYEQFFDEHGEPMVLPEGYHAINYRWKNGQMVEQAFLDLEDKPTAIEAGYAQIRYEYDKDGKNTAREYLDADGHFADFGAGYSRCEISYYSEKPKSYRYYQMDGTPGAGPEGAFEVQYRYDMFGGVCEIFCFGPDGSPILCEEGWHRFLQLRNGDKRIVEKACYGTDGQLTAGKDGWLRQTTEYNDRGLIASRTTWGQDGKPAPVKDTYATVCYEYDAEGRIRLQRYLGPDGEPIACRKGYPAVRYIRDEQGVVTGEYYLDSQGMPLSLEKGYFGRSFLYGENGKVSRITYLNYNGKPIEIGSGYSDVLLEYDEEGNVIRQQFMNQEGQVIYERIIESEESDEPAE